MIRPHQRDILTPKSMLVPVKCLKVSISDRIEMGNAKLNLYIWFKPIHTEVENQLQQTKLLKYS